MNQSVKTITPELIKDNVFQLIGSDWMLITAGNIKSFNMMTASWGGFGVLWNKNVCWCFIRPQRHTRSFMDTSDHFTLSFFSDEHKEALEFCGSHSGKHVNKTAKTELTPVETSTGTVYFAEAKLVIECKKIYFHDIDPANFVDKTIKSNYSQKDYHRMYIGEITNCLLR